MMTRIILLIGLVLNASYAVADWPRTHFLKCRITTNDTTVTGYFIAPHESLPESALVKLKTDKRYFEKMVLNRLTHIELREFIYVHYYMSDNKLDHALYKSENRMLIEVKSIRTIELLETVNFDFVPNTILTKVNPQDIVWMRKPVVKIIQDKNQCYPLRFLVYDATIDYKGIIKKALMESDIQEIIIEELSRYKIICLRLNLCD